MPTPGIRPIRTHTQRRRVHPALRWQNARRLAHLSSKDRPRFLDTWKIGQWNTLRIRCVGKYPRITTWINNVKMADFDGATCPQPDYNKDEIYRQLGREGPIAFQVHGGKQMWKRGAKSAGEISA